MSLRLGHPIVRLLLTGNIHEQDPHSPYRPSPPYDKLHTLGHRANIPTTKAGLNLINTGGMPLSPADLDHLRGLYMGEVAYMDAYLGWMLDRLEEKGLRDDTLIVFLSDHGEEFMEHGHFGHRRQVYEETVRIPLIVSWPGVIQQGKRSDAIVRILDVGPTILDFAGVGAPANWPDRSLRPELLSLAEGDRAHAAFFSLYRRSVDYQAVRHRQWKLIRTHRDGWQELELYDLERDPEERFNRWSSEPVVAEVLLEMLNRHHSELEEPPARIRPPRAEPPSPELLENLRALGYVE